MLDHFVTKEEVFSRDYFNKPPSIWTSHSRGIQLYRADTGAINSPHTLGRSGKAALLALLTVLMMVKLHDSESLITTGTPPIDVARRENVADSLVRIKCWLTCDGCTWHVPTPMTPRFHTEWLATIEPSLTRREKPRFGLWVWLVLAALAVLTFLCPYGVEFHN